MERHYVGTGKGKGNIIWVEEVPFYQEEQNEKSKTE